MVVGKLHINNYLSNLSDVQLQSEIPPLMSDQTYVSVSLFIIVTSIILLMS